MDAEATTRTDAGGYVIGQLTEFPEGSHRIVEVGGRQIGIFNIRNELYALPNICPHQTGPVCAGRSLTGSVLASKDSDWKPEWVHEGEVIVCPWHGLEYHVPTGQCLAFRQIHLRRYAVYVDGGSVVIDLNARAGQPR